MTKETRLALQTHLLGVIDSSLIEWENDTDFEVPDKNTAYYKVNLITGGRSNSNIDVIEPVASGIFQVTMFFSNNKGANPMDEQAEVIINHFQGAKLLYDDVKVKILMPPYFTPLSNTSDRYIGAVSIPYTAHKI